MTFDTTMYIVQSYSRGFCLSAALTPSDLTELPCSTFVGNFFLLYTNPLLGPNHNGLKPLKIQLQKEVFLIPYELDFDSVNAPFKELGSAARPLDIWLKTRYDYSSCTT